MPPSLLITQCLQNDFVKPIGRYEPLTNILHVGYEEARRLMGEKPAEGPVARVMGWAYGTAEEKLKLVHIRDWHDPLDPAQASHLQQFGPHCLKDSAGARFVFAEPAAGAKKASIIDSLTLNDFQGTDLAAVLAPLAGTKTNVGLLGVWTEAKITYLAYELSTRYPEFTLAVCSALTASSSRAQHFMALDQLQKLLGVLVIPSIGEFIGFLGGQGEAAHLPVPAAKDQPAIEIEGAAVTLSETDTALIRYLFRDSKTAHLRCLDGGFSGNVVLGTRSTDLMGHAQVPNVLKIGPQALIGRERAAFERVESVLGNNAPHLAEFADLADRGAIKYRYAAMGGGTSTTFQKLYCAGLAPEKTRRYLTSVFSEQLGRFYQAASREKANLLEYYCFSPDIAPRLRQRVAQVLGAPADGKSLRFKNGREFDNPCLFYEEELATVMPLANRSSYFSYLHGDLNGANIIVDGHENVWLIDFFHTHRGHVLKDLLKLENDVLYIYTPVGGPQAFEEALRLSDLLSQVRDLASPLPEPSGLTRPEFQRAYETVSLLRSFYPTLIGSDRDPLQLFIGQLRYAAHTLSFDESDAEQKKWALYTMSLAAGQIASRLKRAGPLRVDWLEDRFCAPGRLGLTLLPGRRDYDRDLAQDLAALKEQGVTYVVNLLAAPELHQYGVETLMADYAKAGLLARSLPIVDQKVCGRAEMRSLVEWIALALKNGGRVAVHCAGGLGRSGLVAACYLRSKSLSPESAIAEVRRARSPRAIESRDQEDFIRRYS